MAPIASLLLVLSLAPATPQSMLDDLRSAVGSGSRQRVEALFAEKTHGAYLFEMAARRGGLGKLGVKVFPSPPGWAGGSGYWATFHTYQDIEDDHDPVYPLVSTPSGLRLGREVGEEEGGHNRIGHSKVIVRLRPATHIADVQASLTMKSPNRQRAPLFRLNDIYRLHEAKIGATAARVVTADGNTVPTVPAGGVLRVGGLLIPWTAKAVIELTFRYRGVVNRQHEDKITASVCYLTANWVPSTGRLPHTSQVAIVGPREWVLRSEGVPEKAPTLSHGPNEQVVAYRCDLPISYPKVVGGRYRLAASLESEGKTYRAYHLDPVEPARARKDVKLAAAAVAWFEKTLGPFPFPGYDVFDADTYYGIESYSYTLLHRRITTQFVAHEIGHTYFGGLVPSAYVRDTWNEGVTQYVDSVLYGENADRTLEGGLRTVSLRVPLNRMNVAHAFDSATYYRGAYAMRMLENEIGREAVLRGLRAMIADRRGKDTVWADLRAYFERAGGQELGWFWRQWIEGAMFPQLAVTEAVARPVGGGWRTRIQVRQSGTAQPFRLRFTVRLKGGATTADQTVTADTALMSAEIQTSFKPESAELELLGLALARGGRSVDVRVGASLKAVAGRIHR